jgi:hypothetical protein
MATRSEKWWNAYTGAEYQIAPQFAAWRYNRKIRRRAKEKPSKSCRSAV